MSKKKSLDGAEELQAAQTTGEPSDEPMEKPEDATAKTAAEAEAAQETAGAQGTDAEKADADDVVADDANPAAGAEANTCFATDAGEPDDGVDAEIAEAEAALRAAQERLEAAKAKRGENTATAGSSVPPWTPYSTGGAYVGPDPAATSYTAPTYGAAAPTPGYTAPQQGYVPPSYGSGPAAQAQAQPQPQTPNAGPSAVPPQTPPYYGYQQPYYQQPYAQPVVSPKDHVAAGLLAIFLGWLGIHKFYLGYNTAGFIMLGVSILGGILTLSLASWVIWVIAIIEGIMYFTKSQTEFEQTYVLRRREWF